MRGSDTPYTRIESENFCTRRQKEWKGEEKRRQKEGTGKRKEEERGKRRKRRKDGKKKGACVRVGVYARGFRENCAVIQFEVESSH